MRVLGSFEPSIFTSLNSAAHSGLVKSYGPSVRNWPVLFSVNGSTLATHANTFALAVSTGRHSPLSVPIGHCALPTKRPSSARAAIIAAAAAWPIAIPCSFSGLSGIPST